MHIRYVLLSGFVTLIAPGLALAQDRPNTVEPKSAEPLVVTKTTESSSVDDIVVTARRRNELLQNVPIAVSAISQETAIRSGITGLEAIVIATPSLDFSRQISQGATPFLRGVGSTSASAGGESPVAVYVDDVYIGSPSGNIFEFNNIAGIQVLKGPQGTLFGRNATGGVIQIQTKRPNESPSLSANLGYGNFESFEGSLYGNAPISEGIAVNLAISGHTQEDGFGRSLINGVETQKGWDWNIRSQVAWDRGTGTKALLIVDYGQQRSDIGSNSRPPQGSVAAGGAVFVGPYVTQTLGTDFARIKQGGLSLRVDQEASFADLVSITAYRYTGLEFFFDTDLGPNNLVNVGPVISPNRTFTQEFQLVSKPESSIKWLAGFFYLRTETGYDRLTVGGLFFQPLQSISLIDSQTLNSYSAFGEATVPLTPDTNFTAGLRYTRDEYSMELNGRFANETIPLPENTFRQNDTFPKLTYRAILDHKVNQDVMVYGSYSRGFRSGGYNLASPGDTASPAPAVRPETIDAFEVGVKTKILQGHLTFNGAIFYYNYRDLAVAFVIPGGSLTLNAAGAHIKGADFDFSADPFRGLRISGGLGILDGNYSSFPNGPVILPNPATCLPSPVVITGPRTGGNIACSSDLKGNAIVRAPKFTLSISPSYTWVTSIGKFIAAGSYYHNSGYFWDVANRDRQPTYDIVNSSLTWERVGGQYSIRLWAKNLTDERYAISRDADVTSERVSYAAPRTYGATASVKF